MNPAAFDDVPTFDRKNFRFAIMRYGKEIERLVGIFEDMKVSGRYPRQIKNLAVYVLTGLADATDEEIEQATLTAAERVLGKEVYEKTYKPAYDKHQAEIKVKIEGISKDTSSEVKDVSTEPKKEKIKIVKNPGKKGDPNGPN